MALLDADAELLDAMFRVLEYQNDEQAKQIEQAKRRR